MNHDINYINLIFGYNQDYQEIFLKGFYEKNYNIGYNLRSTYVHEIYCITILICSSFNISHQLYVIITFFLSLTTPQANQFTIISESQSQKEFVFNHFSSPCSPRFLFDAFTNHQINCQRQITFIGWLNDRKKKGKRFWMKVSIENFPTIYQT